MHTPCTGGFYCHCFLIGSHFTCLSVACFSYSTIPTKKSLNSPWTALVHSFTHSCPIPGCAYHNLSSLFFPTGRSHWTLAWLWEDPPCGFLSGWPGCLVGLSVPPCWRVALPLRHINHLYMPGSVLGLPVLYKCQRFIVFVQFHSKAHFIWNNLVMKEP